jgi:SAM-dependent methyltransferase
MRQIASGGRVHRILAGFSKIKFLFRWKRTGNGVAFFNCGRQGARSWHERTVIAVDLLANTLAAGRGATPLRLLDIGCGDEKVAEELRRRQVAVDYIGYDLHPQSAFVRPLDLNQDEIRDRGDVAIVLGVIEYIRDPLLALSRLNAAAPALVVSHAARDLGRPVSFDPSSLNWCFCVDQATFETLLTSAGYAVKDKRVTPDGKTAVWLCQRVAVAPHPNVIRFSPF